MVIPLKKKQKVELPANIIKQLSENPYNFNPSLVKLDEINFLAIRSFNISYNKIEAIIYIYNDREELGRINLTDFFSYRHDIPYVADPKLFVLNNEVWGTFNTGSVEKGDNSIVLFSLEGFKIKEFYLCVLNDRIRIEKNWAFYIDNGMLKVLYSISPLVILTERSRAGDTIIFDKECVFEHKKYPGYSIGTPLFFDGENYLFIAHRKLVYKSKRLYLGRPFTFSPNNYPKIRGGDKFLFHSFKSLLGAKHKFNKNLISCTYFSGINIEGIKATLGYGINDTSFNIIKIDINKIWN